MRLIIFDWDDTIIPTSSLNMENLTEDKVLSSNVSKLFGQAEKCSHKIIIVTNASYEWVTICLNVVIPDCKEIIMKYPIYSTLDNGFQQVYHYKLWKKEAFYVCLEYFFNKNETNELISFGDSPHDRYASMWAMLNYKIIVKNIHLKHLPTRAELISQQSLIYILLPYIYRHENSIDCQLTDDILYEPNNLLSYIRKGYFYPHKYIEQEILGNING